MEEPAPAVEGRQHGLQGRLGQLLLLQGGEGSVLREGRGVRRHLTLQFPHGLGDRRRRDQRAQSPAGHGIGF